MMVIFPPSWLGHRIKRAMCFTWPWVGRLFLFKMRRKLSTRTCFVQWKTGFLAKMQTTVMVAMVSSFLMKQKSLPMLGKQFWLKKKRENILKMLQFWILKMSREG